MLLVVIAARVVSTTLFALERIQKYTFQKQSTELDDSTDVYDLRTQTQAHNMTVLYNNNITVPTH